FLNRTRTVWKKVPRFVLLVGDADGDSRNYLGLGNGDFVPTKMVETMYLKAASDDWYADFDDSGLASMAVGRLPVRTASDYDVIVSKIIRSEQSTLRLDSVLVADKNDGFDFENAEKSVKVLMPASWPVQEVIRSKTDDNTAKSQILGALTSGTKIVNYSGHGSGTIWRGNLLTVADAAGLAQPGRPALAGCRARLERRV